MTRDEVRWRRALWNEKEYHHYRIASAGKRRKRRGPPPHPNKEDKPVIHELIEETRPLRENRNKNGKR
jgi:hypothetical protein